MSSLNKIDDFAANRFNLNTIIGKFIMLHKKIQKQKLPNKSKVLYILPIWTESILGTLFNFPIIPHKFYTKKYDFYFAITFSEIVANWALAIEIYSKHR